MSRHCKNYLVNIPEWEGLRKDHIQGVNFVTELKNERRLKIYCYENKQITDVGSEELEKYQSLIMFSFIDLIEMDVSTMPEYFGKLRRISEELKNESHNNKTKIVEIIDKNLAYDCMALVDVIEDGAKNFNLFMLISHFVFAFDFLFEVYTFSLLNNILTFLYKFNVKRVYQTGYGDDLQKNLQITDKDLARILESLQNALTMKLLKSDSILELEDDDIYNVRCLLNLQEFLYVVNNLLPEAGRLPKEEFFNEEVFKSETDLRHQILSLTAEEMNTDGQVMNHLQELLLQIQQRKLLDNFNLFNYPFLFPVEKKVDFLGFENKIQQHMELQSNLGGINNIFALLNNGIHLKLKLRRNNILEDTMSQLHNKGTGNALKKPLRIEFEGEPGVDEGGLTKEFFQLLIAQLFDPNFGMFSVKNERFYWFNSNSFECNVNFELIGTLLGIALYNNTLLELQFPLLVYKKLKLANGSDFIDDEIRLEDIQEIEPEIYNTLANIKKLDLNEVPMGITFSITYEVWGQPVERELKPGGSLIEVTEDNKLEFIALYLDWIANESIKNQFTPFYKGFNKVMTGHIIKRFNGEELFQAICGTDELDFNALKETARYEDGYTKDSETVKLFWKILIDDFDHEDKKSFLKFLTGSDRAPLKGLGNLKIAISRYGDGDQLPAAHTCFNHLLLPDYKSYSVLKKKLKMALEHCEGFGLF